jgi:hypothetical protein
MLRSCCLERFSHKNVIPQKDSFSPQVAEFMLETNKINAVTRLSDG